MTSNPSFRTILRYQIAPGYGVDDRVRELVALCEEGLIEEVMLLILAEELNTGHPTPSEWDEWIVLARHVRTCLGERGVALSLNPWTTTHGVPRGRTLRDGQNFRLMAGETGADNGITACPLCPEWQRYLSESFARLAREVEPVAIWVEDDWRLHNHGAELGWGGCFCEEHLRRFSEVVGSGVHRQDLLDALLAPGTPHPWRRLWFELSRETLLEPMRVLQAAIQAANPSCELGLMTSRPDQHSVEGRDWAAMAGAVSGRRPFLLRPHMEPYTEERTLRTTASVTRHTIACLRGPVRIYPELENSPRCGVYSKSGRQTVWQMLEAAVLGAPGITINHFDNMGCGTLLDPAFSGHLARAKSRLGALAALGLDDRRAEGVEVVFSPRIAEFLELPALGDKPARIDAKALAQQMERNPSVAGASGFAGSLQSLVHPSPVWAETCAILGIAHRLVPGVGGNNGIRLLNGQTPRALADEEIIRLLSGVAVLDATSAHCLAGRGYSEHLGVEIGPAKAAADDVVAYEEIVEPDPAVYGIANPRLCAQRIAAEFCPLAPRPGAETLTVLRNPAHRVLWPGVTAFRNALGGRVVVLAYPIDGSAQFFMAYFNTFRRQFWQNLFLAEPRGSRLLLGPDATRCYRQPVADGTLFAVMNPTLDEIPEFAIRINPTLPQGSWHRLCDDGSWEAVCPHGAAGWLEFATALRPLDGGFFLHQIDQCHPPERLSGKNL